VGRLCNNLRRFTINIGGLRELLKNGLVLGVDYKPSLTTGRVKGSAYGDEKGPRELGKEGEKILEEEKLLALV